MHIQLATALVVVALASSLMLLVNRSDKFFPVMAVVAASIELLIAFGIVELSIGRYRIEVILAGLIALAGGVCWARAKDKSDTTSATALLGAGMIQLLLALSVMR